jgi:DNA-binding NarL/FixJ family response regulator
MLVVAETCDRVMNDDVDRQTKIRVLVADDSALVRKRLIALLSSIGNVEIVGQAWDTAETITSVRESKPDIVILDIQMPDGNGIDVLVSIRRERPAPKVIMLTNYPFVQYRRRCMEAGASYFFDKSSEFHKIPQAIEQLSAENARGLRPSEGLSNRKSE